MNSQQNSVFNQFNWNEYAVCYDSLLTLKPYQQLLSVVSSLAKQSDPDMILDAGCGTGNVLTVLREACPSVKLVGLDMSPSMLARAEEKCSPDELTTILQGDLNKTLPFGDNSFSLVTCINVLYAVIDPAKTLREIFRLLTPSSKLILVTPKQGFDNGFILKEHCQSPRTLEYWKNAHASPERERLLLNEAIGDKSVIEQMLLVAKYNRYISQSLLFHFLSQEELFGLATDAGFVEISLTSIYAGQAHLLSAQKG